MLATENGFSQICFDEHILHPTLQRRYSSSSSSSSSTPADAERQQQQRQAGSSIHTPRRAKAATLKPKEERQPAAGTTARDEAAPSREQQAATQSMQAATRRASAPPHASEPKRNANHNIEKKRKHGQQANAPFSRSLFVLPTLPCLSLVCFALALASLLLLQDVGPRILFLSHTATPTHIQRRGLSSLSVRLHPHPWAM